MRILHVSTSFCPVIGGKENYISNLCLQLIKRGHQSDVLTLRKEEKTDRLLPENDTYGDIKVRRISHWGPERFKLFPLLFKYIEDYDLLHIHDVRDFCNYFTASKWYHRKPIIISTHGGFFHTKKFQTIKKIYFRTILPIALKRTNKVIAVSDHDYDIFHKICPNAIVVQNGIDYERFSKVKKNIKENCFLYFGRISRNKGLFNLIETIDHIRRKIPDIHLDIVGRDWEGIQAGLEKLVKMKNLQKNIYFRGEVSGEKLMGYLAHANYFVSASEYEGFGLTVLEAMSSKTIPIVNDIDPLNRFIQNEENGFIVNFSKPELAADEIVNIMKTNSCGQNEISNNAKSFARSFAWENIVQKIEAVYLDTLTSLQ